MPPWLTAAAGTPWGAGAATVALAAVPTVVARLAAVLPGAAVFGAAFFAGLRLVATRLAADFLAAAVFFAGTFLVAVFFAADFFGVAFFTAGFLADDFFAGAFFAAAFFAVVFFFAGFFVVAFLAADFFAGAFLAAAFFAVAFLAAGFFVVDFFAADLRAVGFFAAVFFFAAAFFSTGFSRGGAFFAGRFFPVVLRALLAMLASWFTGNGWTQSRPRRAGCVRVVHRPMWPIIESCAEHGKNPGASCIRIPPTQMPGDAMKAHLRGALAAFALVVAGPSMAQAGAQEAVRVGGDPHYPPHHYLGVDGEAEGFDMAVLRAVAAREGLPLQFDFGEWGRTLDRLERGELDVVPMFVSQDRRGRFLFSRPFMRREHRLFTRDGEWIEAPEALAGRRVAVQFGGMAWEWLINAQVDAVLRPVNDESLVLVEVMRGDAEFALLPLDIAEYTIATQGLEGLQVSSPPWLERDYAFGVNPARPDLVGRLDAGLQALEGSGELDGLRQRWLKPVEPAVGGGWSVGWLALALPVLLGALAYSLAGRKAGMRKPQ